MEQIYNKLVRDRIPEIIEINGEKPFVRILSDEEYKQELEKKLLEEYNEVIKAKESEERVEELADMLEVIISLSKLENRTLDDIIQIAKVKKEKHIKEGYLVILLKIIIVCIEILV